MITSAIWLPATLLASLFQAWRTALQQRLRDRLSVNAAGLVRYLYGAPVALVLLGVYLAAMGAAPVRLSWAFFGFAVIGGACQILATNLLIMAFGYRNFVVGTAYAKTEAVQGAVLALWLLGEALSSLTWIGIGVGVVGVLLLSLGGRRLSIAEIVRATVQPAALCGLGAGFLFALTAIAVKRATFELGSGDSVLDALVTLLAVMVLQTLMQGAYVALREPAQLREVLASWRTSAMVGVLAACGSACWFTGFATAPVALVRTVGQVEVVFTLLFGRFYLREPLARSEAAGLGLVALGVVLALVGSR